MGETLNANRVLLCDAIRDLRDDDNFLDVSLAVDDDGDDDGQFVFRAHRVILAASSPIFKNMLAKLRGPDSVVFLHNVRKRDLGHILDFVYSGEVVVASEERDSLLTAARNLKIVSLEDADDTEESHSSPPQPKKAKLASNNMATVVKCEKPSTSTGQADGDEEEEKPVGSQQQQQSLREMMDANSCPLENGILCRICGSILKQRTNLTKHFRDQHYNTNVKYVCPGCKGIYKNYGAFQVHISRSHRELKGLDLHTCVLKE